MEILILVCLFVLFCAGIEFIVALISGVIGFAMIFGAIALIYFAPSMSLGWYAAGIASVFIGIAAVADDEKRKRYRRERGSGDDSDGDD